MLACAMQTHQLSVKDSDNQNSNDHPLYRMHFGSRGFSAVHLNDMRDMNAFHTETELKVHIICIRLSTLLEDLHKNDKLHTSKIRYTQRINHWRCKCSSLQCNIHPLTANANITNNNCSSSNIQVRERECVNA